MQNYKKLFNILIFIKFAEKYFVKFIEKLKYKIGLRKLRKTVRRPETNAIARNLYKAESVGIIYDATENEDFEKVKAFIEKLKTKINKLESLGFVNSTELSEHHLRPLEFQFYSKNDLDKFFKPKLEVINEFCNQKFDILIDFNIIEHLPNRFILAESQAMFKTGLYSETEPNYYDLMINIDKNSENLLEELIKQTEHYLKMINT